VSKLAIEHYLSLYPQLGGISLRVANPYGAYQLIGTAVGVIAHYVAAVRDNLPIEVWGDGSVVRDYIAIADVIEAFRIAATSDTLPAGGYNVGSGAGSSVNEIITAVFAAAGREVPVNYLQGRPYDVPAIVLDSTRFKEMTSWAARTSLHDGIAALWAQCVSAPNT
jgi:UDP-glucose 4-epimerase